MNRLTWLEVSTVDHSLFCRCGHHRDLHTPTGRMDDTNIRGEGTCTAGTYSQKCGCTKYEEKKR